MILEIIFKELSAMLVLRKHKWLGFIVDCFKKLFKIENDTHLETILHHIIDTENIPGIYKIFSKYYLGDNYFFEGFKDLAIKYYNEALESDKEQKQINQFNIDRSYIIAYSYYSRTRPCHESDLISRVDVQMLQKTIMIDSNFVQAYYRRALCYYQFSNYKKAEDDFAKTVYLAYESERMNIPFKEEIIKSYGYLIEFAIKREEYEQASIYLTEIDKFSTDYLTYKRNFYKGFVAFNKQDYESVITYLNKILSYSFEFSDLYYPKAYALFAISYYNLKQYSEAIDVFERKSYYILNDRFGHSFNGYYYYALSCYQAKKYKRAYENFVYAHQRNNEFF